MRAWRLTHAGERPLTVNRVASLHRQQWAKHTSEIRGVWWLLAKEAKVPGLDRARVIATPLHANSRSPQDVAACAPEVKAAIDGLVDAGVLVNDSARYLVEITFRPPRIEPGIDGLELVIEEAA